MKNLLLFLFTMPAVFAQNNNVNLQVNEYDVSIHYENAANRPTLYRQYLKSVFYYSDKDSEKVYRLKQWIDNVVIYFDKNIPKQVKREIIQFYLNMPKIENLDLSFTNNIEEANYFVKLVDKTYFNSRSFYKFKNEQEELSEIDVETGYVSESVLPSPPPVGPTCGIKFGVINFSASFLAKVSN